MRALKLIGLMLLLPSLAMAQSQVTDQLPVPLTSSTGQSELLTQSQSVSGGTLYTTVLRQSGLQGPPIGVASTFVPTGATSPTRYFALTNGKSDLGVPMTAAAGTPTGTVGVSRTAGTSLVLTGEATSGAQAKTDKVIFEFDLADTYVVGTNIPLIVNQNYSGTVVTAGSTTITASAYTEAAGVEAAVTVSAAQQMTATAGNLTFSITGTNLVPGQHMVVELVMLVTSASGAVTGQINSVAYQG